jgi:hypothetical protein
MTQVASSPTPAETKVQHEIAALANSSLAELRQAWRDRYGAPPKLRSAELMRHLLAWRIQTTALGGLDRETRQALKRATPKSARRRLQPGVRLAREHRGVEHEVEVVENGFRYRGELYASLSVIARDITGTRWNGWRFFGVAETGR